MREIERTTRFKRDFKREQKTDQRLPALLFEAIESLAADEPLPVKFRDHGLTGEGTGFRDCHIRPDLVLIYQKTGDNVLRLARLGSHSELF